MTNSTKIAFIGPGVMAEAMIVRLIEAKIASSDQVVAAGPRPKRGKELEKNYGITYTADNVEAAKQARHLILAVKPQQLEKALAPIKGGLPKEASVISIVAGVGMQRIATLIDHPNIIRAMPNTPAQIGKGITVWTASASVSELQKKEAEEILAALGQTVFVDEESYLDKATALSGTGPAYAFLFMEAMVDAGVHLGFPRRLAEQLVVETLRGSVDFYDQSEEAPRHLARLRNQVTSPGGTSAEALYYLEKAGFRTAISRAIWAAYERSRRLGSPDSNLRETPNS